VLFFLHTNHMRHQSGIGLAWPTTAKSARGLLSAERGAARFLGRAPRFGSVYYREIAQRFSAYDFRAIARAIGSLHPAENLWQDTRGRI
jgi:hypothetical protein